MLPLALVVVILGGTGSLLGSLRRQLRRRLPLQFRPGAVSRARLRRPVPADAARAGVPAAGPVRQASRREAACALALAVALRRAGARCRSGSATATTSTSPSQMLIYAIFALGLNVLVGYAGLVSLGHAGLFGIAAYAGAILINDGLRPHRRRIVGALVVTLAADGDVRGAGAARHRPRLRHDHAGARPDRLGHRLSLDQPHQRRQRHLDQRAAGAVRPVAGERRPAFY